MKINKLGTEKQNEDTYPGFDYQAGQLSKFLAASDLFTMLLKNGEIIHFTPNDKVEFEQWLIKHKVENIKL